MTSTPTKLLVPGSGKLVLLDFDEITWIEARGNYSVLHAGEQSYRMRTTVKDLLPKLPAGQFMRVHRSAVVNLARIREIGTGASGRHEIILSTGASLPLSRERWKELKRELLQWTASTQELAAS